MAKFTLRNFIEDIPRRVKPEPTSSGMEVVLQIYISVHLLSDCIEATYLNIYALQFQVLCVRAWWQRRNMVVSSDLEMLPTEEKNSRIILSVEDEKVIRYPRLCV